MAMRKKSVLFVTLLAALHAAPGVHAADMVEIRNAQWGFRTEYPAAWTVQQGETGPIYVSAAPPAPETLVRCNTTAEKVPDSLPYKQSQLNEGLKDAMGDEFWSGQVFGRFKNVKVESRASRLHPSGVQIQEAVVSYTDTVDGKAENGRTATAIFVTPGATFSISCNAQAGKFKKYKADFAAITDSFRLKDADTVNAAPSAGQSAVPVSFSTGLFGAAIVDGVSLAGQ